MQAKLLVLSSEEQRLLEVEGVTLPTDMPLTKVLKLFTCSSNTESWGSYPGGGGGQLHMKQTGMLIVSLRGVNFGFWSRLGCSAQSANILSRQGRV